MAATREPRPLGESSTTVTVKLTSAQLAALARATFTDTSARPAAEKNAAEAAIKAFQVEARRRGHE